jgi:hypothetical protein
MDPVRAVWLAMLPLLVAWKLWLFKPGQFHVQWVMTRFEVLCCALQEVMVWGALYAGVCLLLAWRSGRAARVVALAAAPLVLLLHLVDVRCKQILYQPLAWSTLREAAADAGVARSSASLFFGRLFVAAALASFAVLLAAGVWASRRARRRTPTPRLQRDAVSATAVFAVAALLVAVVGRAQPYHLDGNILSGWTVDHLRERQADAQTRAALSARCDQPARLPRTPTAAAPARGRNVVIFVAESLSYSASSLADPSLDTTPFLADLAALGPIATACRVQAAASTKSLYSLLTGRYASPTLEMLESMAPRLDSLPRTLARAGYATVLLSSQFLSFENSGRQYRAMGFDRLVGAEELIARARRAGRTARLSSSWGVDDRELAAAVPALLPADHRPFLLVVYDVASHHPFDYPGAPPAATEYQRYLQAVRYGDQALQAVHEALRRAGHAEDTLFVLLGDHGENITPRDYRVRGCLLSEIEHVVPLVIALPGSAPPLHAAQAPPGAREIDVVPTVLALLGVSPDAPLQGRSLLDGGAPPAAYINSHGRCRVAGVVDGTTKQLLDLRTHEALTIDLTAPDADEHPRPLPAAAAGALAARLDACAAYNEAALRGLVPP